jgi:hypothetical protein
MFLMPSLCHDSMIDSCYFVMFCDTIFTEIKYFINQPTANTVVVHMPHPYTVRVDVVDIHLMMPRPPSPRRLVVVAGSVVHAVLESVVPDLIVMRSLSPVVVGA